MSEVDRITDSGKRAIADLLNKSLQVEYGMLLNYPRILDQIVRIDEITDKLIPGNLEMLGKESLKHAGMIGQLVVQLGGEPQWDIKVIDRMIDIGSMLVQQLGKEKAVLLLYQQAKLVAQQNQVKAKGFLSGLIKWGDGESRDVAKRSDTISTLSGLINDETRHIQVVKNMIAAWDIETKK